MASYIYVEIKVTWFFEKSPTRFAFYDDKNCDAFNDGRFSDSITDYKIVDVVGSIEATLSRLRAIENQKYRYEMAIPDVTEIEESEYIDGTRWVKECIK